jgi:3',5'-cyclic-AMP phosphodiesterase
MAQTTRHLEGISMMKMIALSDLHLVPRGGISKGLDTAERLRLALADICAKHADAAFCVMMGDLADKGEIGAYEQLSELTRELPMPIYLMVGNHDDRQYPFRL